MNKLFIILVLLFVTTFASSQEEYTRHKIGVIVGIRGPLGSGLEHNDMDVENLMTYGTYSPTLSLSYNWNMTRRWSFGARLSYMHWNYKSFDVVTKNPYGCNIAQHNCYSFMPAIKFNWIRKKHFGMHSSVAVGVGVNHQKQDLYEPHDKVYCDPAFDITFLGFEVGWKHITGVIDLNIGTATFLSGGICYSW